LFTKNVIKNIAFQIPGGKRPPSDVRGWTAFDVAQVWGLTRNEAPEIVYWQNKHISLFIEKKQNTITRTSKQSRTIFFGKRKSVRLKNVVPAQRHKTRTSSRTAINCHSKAYNKYQSMLRCWVLL